MRASEAKDAAFMARALHLAGKARGQTSPNPMVGCVLVKGGKVVGEGYHTRAGAAHAEIEALTAAGKAAKGATAYVTLEPCDHVGRTGKCTDALIAAGIKRVVAAMMDPNPRVRGRGISRLGAAGLTVDVGLLGEAAAKLNDAYVCWVTRGRPLVTMKAAISLDGRIATQTGDARWISNTESRIEAHRLRASSDAILVGAGTVRVDNPELTVRVPGLTGRDPLRVVVDGKLSISPRAKVVRAGTLVFTAKRAPEAKEKQLRARGCDVVRTAGRGDKVDLKEMLGTLAALGVTTLLVEGGADVHGRFLEAKLVDRIELFVAPKLIGARGLPMAAWSGVRNVADALSVEDLEVRRLGDDLWISGRLG